MAENGLPDSKRPKRRSPLHKRKQNTARRKGRVEEERVQPLSLSSSSIVSFFNNVPPAKVTCPLCGQMVARYRINQHIDEECRNNQEDENVDLMTLAVSSPSAKNGAAGSSPYFANEDSTPERNPSPPGGWNSGTNMGAREQRSPYFKKAGSVGPQADEPRTCSVNNISLGSLSAKLSKRRPTHSRDELAQEDQSCTTQAGAEDQKWEATIFGKGSQKENQLPQEFHGTAEGLNEEYEIPGKGQESALDSFPNEVGDVSPGLFLLGDPAGRGFGLMAEGPPWPKTHRKDSDVHQVAGSSGPSTTAGPSNLEFEGFSSNEQDQVTGTEGTSHHPIQNFSFMGDDAGLIEFMDEAGLDLSEEASELPGSESDSAGHPYYLRNFRMVLEAVLENEEDRRLFDEQDLAVIQRFYLLSAGGQKLYVRLFQRKLAWMKTNKIDYAEISLDLSPFFKELVGAEFLQSEVELLNLTEALDLLSAPELKTLAKAFHLKTPTAQKKQVMEEFLRLAKQRSVFGASQAGIGGVILKRAKAVAGKCIKVCQGPRAVFSRVLLLFSLADPVEDEEAGSGGQRQLTTVLMANMGRTVFPTYTVNRKTPIFQDRDDFIRYAAAVYTSSDIATAMADGQWKEALRLYQTARESWKMLNEHPSLSHHATLPVYLRRFTVGWLYTRILSRGVDILQRLHKYEEAVEQLQELLGQAVYCVDSRGHWWERLALNLHQHLKETEKALRCIRDGLQDPFLRPAQHLSFSQRVLRMKEAPACRRFQQLLCDLPLLSVEDVPHVTIRGKLCPQTGMGKSMFILEDQKEGLEPSTVVCSVEELALAHYKQNGFDQGFHGEGSTFTTLYSLLMWDILFMDGIPDVFRNSYQAFPLDLYTDSFYENRQEAIEARLESLCDASTETLKAWMAEVWNAQQGKAAALIGWDRFSSLQQAQSLACCFGGPFLSGVCRRFSKDLRHSRGGLPDLVVWRTKDRQFKLVEVKGPNDRLSPKQQIWLAELQKLGASVEVCHVVAVGSKMKCLS